jgi:hypothetical protein
MDHLHFAIASLTFKIRTRRLLSIVFRSGLMLTLLGALIPMPVNVVQAAAPTQSWRILMGSSSVDDFGYGVAVDSSGNVYVTGRSSASWGSPLKAFAGEIDAFVAKLDSSGALIWNTFVGGTGVDFANDIVVSSNGNIYITGESAAAWGSPRRSYSGSADGFVAKLDSSGALQWNTFQGSNGYDSAHRISIDDVENIYITGQSDFSWGNPYNPSNGSTDAFVAKLDSEGDLYWNSFVGGSGDDRGYGIAVDNTGNIYISGNSTSAWGSPLRSFSSDWDCFAAKLSNSGALLWNTFLGGPDLDPGASIAVDANGNVFISGQSHATWGSPLNAFTGYSDGFVARLDNNGVLQWNTFLGGGGNASAYNLVVDNDDNLYLTGYSSASWCGWSPAFSGTVYSFIAKFDSNGACHWSTYLRNSGEDSTNDIALFGSGNLYVTGESRVYLGSPINDYDKPDALVARYTFPLPAVQGNGQAISSGDNTPSPGDFTDFGTLVSGQTLMRSFTLLNSGEVDLALTNSGLVSIGGPGAADFTLVNAPSSPILPGGQTTFAIRFNPGILGPRQATVSISNNSNTDPYTFAIQGTGIAAPTLALQDATGLTTTAITLNATVNPNYADSSVTFDYGMTDTYGTSLEAAPATLSGGSAAPISVRLSGLFPNRTYHYRLSASNAAGTTFGADQTFTTLPTASQATTTAANHVTTTSATLNGAVNPNNQSTTVSFEYGPTASYGFTVEAEQGTLTGSASLAVSAPVSGFVPGSTFHYRVVATNPTGTTRGADQTVLLAPVPEIVLSGKNVTIPSGSATPALATGTDWGVVRQGSPAIQIFTIQNTGGLDLVLSGDPKVEIGGPQASDFTVSANPASPIIPGSSTTFTITFAPGGVGLRQAAVSIANNSDQTPYTFTIQGTGASAPTLTTQAATGLTTTSATLNGTVAPNYTGGAVTFEYGLTTAYESSLSADPGSVTGNSLTPVSGGLSGLRPKTTYHFRLVVTGAGGVTYGEDQVFTTLPLQIFISLVRG